MADVVKTRTDLIRRALDHLGVTATGQAVSAEDQESVDGAVDGVLAELAAREVVYIADSNAIPTEWFECLSLCLADAISPAYGAAGSLTALVFTPMTGAEDRLRLMQRSKPTYQALYTLDF
jgi:hypothetical protein